MRGQRQGCHTAVQGRADVIQVVVLGQKDHGEHGIGKQHPHRQGDGTAHAVLRVAPDAVGWGRAESAVAVVGCSGWCSFGANVHVHVVMFVRIILTTVVIRRTCRGCLPRFVVEVVLVSVVVVATVVSGGSCGARTPVRPAWSAPFGVATKRSGRCDRATAGDPTCRCFRQRRLLWCHDPAADVSAAPRFRLPTADRRPRLAEDTSCYRGWLGYCDARAPAPGARSCSIRRILLLNSRSRSSAIVGSSSTTLSSSSIGGDAVAADGAARPARCRISSSRRPNHPAAARAFVPPCRPCLLCVIELLL